MTSDERLIERIRYSLRAEVAGLEPPRDLVQRLRDELRGDVPESVRRRPRLPSLGGTVGVLTACLALAFAGLLLVLLGHHRPTSTGAVGHRARTYRDPAGWSVNVPPGWHVVRFSESRDGVGPGAQFSNVRLPKPASVPGYPIQVNERVLPARGIGLIIATASGPHPSHVPLAVPPLPSPSGGKDWGVASAPPGSSYLESLWFRGNGKTFIATGKVGPKATVADLKAFAAIIRSLRFQSARGVVAGRFPGAPRTQPGGCPSPLAPPNRYLPKGASCVTVAYADVDGDGRPDLILLYGDPTTHRVHGLFLPAVFTLKVVRASGGALSTRVPALEPPTIILLRDVNNRPGDEIFIHETHVSSGEYVGVYAFDGHRLRRAGGFWGYGGDSAQQYGITCHLGDPATIVQHQFLLEGPTMFGRWQRTDTTYLWAGAALRRIGQRTTQDHGLPPKSLTDVGC